MVCMVVLIDQQQLIQLHNGTWKIKEQEALSFLSYALPSLCLCPLKGQVPTVSVKGWLSRGTDMFICRSLPGVIPCQQTARIVSCSKGSNLVLQTDLHFCKTREFSLKEIKSGSSAVNRFHPCRLFLTNINQCNFPILLGRRIHTSERKQFHITGLLQSFTWFLGGMIQTAKEFSSNIAQFHFWTSLRSLKSGRQSSVSVAVCFKQVKSQDVEVHCKNVFRLISVA